MPFPIAAAAVLGAGAMSYFGSKETNDTNAWIAKQQMNFQERMSSTAYQRATEDMRKAGINPILAASQGGASTPPGASYQAQNELGSVVSSAMEARRLNAEIDAIKEGVQTQKVSQQTQLTEQEKNRSQIALNEAIKRQSLSQAQLNSASARNVSTQESLARTQMPKASFKEKLWNAITHPISSAKSLGISLRSSPEWRKLNNAQ